MIVKDPAENHRVYAAYANEHNIEGILTRFALDAVIIGPNRTHITGTDNIRAYYEKLLHRLKELKFEPLDIIVNGDIALERLHYTVVMTLPSGEEAVVSSVSNAVLTRLPSGNWVISVDDPGP